MKKNNYWALLLVLGFVFYTACSDDEFTEQDALNQLVELDSLEAVRDSLAKVGGIVDFSVKLVNANGKNFVDVGSRSSFESELSGISVTVAQHGVTQTVVSDSSGVVGFADLRIGRMAVRVSADQLSDVDMVVEIGSPDGVNGNLQTGTASGDPGQDFSGVRRQAAISVPLFSSTSNTATISGVVTADTDLTNVDVEAVANATVIASIDTDDPVFQQIFLNVQNITANSTFTRADVINAVYSDAAFTAVTDANGAYSLQVPAIGGGNGSESGTQGEAGGLPIIVEVDEFAADQTLTDAAGVFTARARFGPDAVATALPTDGATNFGTSGDPFWVFPPFVTASDPTGTSFADPSDTAQAEAVLTAGGVIAINITDPGMGYTQPPVFEVDTTQKVDAEFEVLISNGAVSGVSITNPGAGYPITPDFSSLGVVVEDGVEDVMADPELTFSIKEEEIDLAAASGGTVGTGYMSEPIVVINAQRGSGATAEAQLDGVIDTILVSSGGTGFTQDPVVQLVGEASTVVAASANMSQFNPIHSLNLRSSFTSWFETTPTVEIERRNGGTGSGARAAAVLASDNGRIARIVITNPGSGYDQDPSILIVGGGGSGASAEAFVSQTGQLDSIRLLSRGRSFSSVPTVQITAPTQPGGVQATAVAVLEFQVDELTLTAPGAGYDLTSFNDGDGDNDPGEEPVVRLNGTPLADSDVDVRPNMFVESVSGSGGSGYNDVPSVQFVSRDGFGSGAAADAVRKFNVDAVLITNGGSGYRNTSEIEVVIVTNPGDADVAAALAGTDLTLDNGTLVDIDISDGGEGYSANPITSLVFDNGTPGDPSDDEVVSNDFVAQFDGDGSITGFAFSDIDGLEGNDADYSIVVSTFVMAANFTYASDAGQIARIDMTDPGSGYEGVPRVEFENVGTGGTGAAGVASVDNGRVTGVNLTSVGNGYVSAPTVRFVVDDVVEMAMLTATVDSKGRVTSIEIIGANATEKLSNRGAGYVDVPTVTIDPVIPGVGAGAAIEILRVVNGGLGDPETGALVENLDYDFVNRGEGYLSSNTPSTAKNYVVFGGAKFKVVSNKAYVRDIYAGTGDGSVD
jgi:hypothetical protein